MAEDGVMPEPEHVDVSKKQAELLEKFCRERKWDPAHLDATQLNEFYDTSEMKDLLRRKYHR